MMSVPIARGAAEHGDDQLWPERAHDAHDIAEHGILRPVFVRFGGGFRESEVVGASEELSRAIGAARRHQLFGTNHAQRFTELIADRILSTVTAREREIRRVGVRATCQPAEQLRVFVVGVRADHEHARGGAQRSGEIVECSGALLRADGHRQSDGDQRDDGAAGQ